MKIIINISKKKFRAFLIVILVIAWVFSGWPQIWQKPPMPPRVPEAKAAAIAQNIIVAWPNASSTIPANWYRDPTLDNFFLIATSSNPGLTGGAATHVHPDVAQHTHTQTNTHSHATNPVSNQGSGTSACGAGTGGSTELHTHTIPDTDAVADAATGNASSVAVSAASNEPSYREFIWIYNADGSTEIPNGAIAFWSTASPPTNWNATTTGLFYKGAPAGTDPNIATQGADNHTHTNAHTHTQNETAHAAGTSGASDITTGKTKPGTATLADDAHTHTVTFSSGGSHTTGSDNGGINTAYTLPPHIGLVAVQNETGVAATPNNMIAIWRGTIASIPTNWKLCQSGGDCNIDIVDKFVKATTTTAVLDTGGTTSHTHTTTAHTHTTTHTHTVSLTGISAEVAPNGTGNTASINTHTHADTTTSNSSTALTDTQTITVNASTAETRPPFYGVAFIQYQSPVSLTLTVTTDTFPNITPGTPVFATSTINVNTTNSSGWYVTLYGDNQGSGSASTTMYLDTPDYNTNFTDQTEWIPGTATTTAGNAVRLGSLDNSADVLAFRVMTASGTVSFISTDWWGTVDDYTDNGSTFWAGIASSTASNLKIGDSSVDSGGGDALNTVLYYLDVPTVQKMGNYTGNLTFTATTNP